MTPKYSHNPQRVNAQEILLKAFQLLETFLATSRCVYFKALFPGLIPTCDNRKYSQKFLLHHRCMCKRWPKPTGSTGSKALQKCWKFLRKVWGLFFLQVEWSQLQNMKLSKTVCSKWNGTSDKLVLSAASVWGAGKVRCNSLFLLMIVIVQICFCKITWETLPYRQLINVTPLKLLMGLEMSIIDLRHHDYFKSQLRFSLLN